MIDNHHEVSGLPSGAACGPGVSPEQDSAGPGIPEHDELSSLHERISQLEGRLVEQDRLVRHTLTMLIEWIETTSEHRQVACNQRQ